MQEWHPLMPAIYARTSSIELAAMLVEDLGPSCTEYILPIPFGTSPIRTPKCAKGTSCESVIHNLRGGGLIWAETKYDGER